jgi:hypothetical protein
MNEPTEPPLPGWLIALLTVGIVGGCLGGSGLLLIEPTRWVGALVLDLIFAAWMGFAARGKGWRRITITGVLVFASLVGVELVAFVPELRRAGLVVLAAVICACVALGMTGAPLARRAGVLAAVVLGLAGIVAATDVRTALTGTVLILVAAGIAIYVILDRWARRHTGRKRRAAAALVLTAAVLMPVGALAFVASEVRGGGSYARWYGTPVVVDVGDTCTVTVWTRNGIPYRHGGASCIAVWEVNGEVQSGKVVGPWDDLHPNKRSQPAYALGDRAFVPTGAEDDGLAPLGRALPSWPIAGLPIGLAVAVLFIVATSRLAPRPPPPPADPY